MKIKEKLYFAYGSNMNTNQMAFRCPEAQVIDTVRLENYRLVFRSNGGGKGVATILPEQGSFVDGVLWRISPKDEQSLDRYEGFPVLYGKETVSVRTSDGKQIPGHGLHHERALSGHPRTSILGISERNHYRLLAASNRLLACSESGGKRTPDDPPPDSCSEKAEPGTVTITYI